MLTRHILAHEGIAYLIENHTRDVAIEGGKLDPNRMFSRVGAEANLKRLNRDWPPSGSRPPSACSTTAARNWCAR